MKKKQLKEHKFSTGAKIGLTIIQLICRISYFIHNWLLLYNNSCFMCYFNILNFVKPRLLNKIIKSQNMEISR